MSEEKRYSLINVQVSRGVMERIASALEGIKAILEIVYHDDITPREPPPKAQAGRLFRQTNDNLIRLQEEARRLQTDAEPDYNDRGREETETETTKASV